MQQSGSLTERGRSTFIRLSAVVLLGLVGFMVLIAVAQWAGFEHHLHSHNHTHDYEVGSVHAEGIETLTTGRQTWRATGSSHTHGSARQQRFPKPVYSSNSPSSSPLSQTPGPVAPPTPAVNTPTQSAPEAAANPDPAPRAPEQPVSQSMPDMTAESYSGQPPVVPISYVETEDVTYKRGGAVAVVEEGDLIEDDDSAHVKQLKLQRQQRETQFHQLQLSHQNLVHIITHTHWDREWYLPFERFRRIFVWVFDDVLRYMRTRPSEMHHFHVDGQVVPFLDYLEIKPEKRDLLVDYIHEGRLSIGPWYTAPDEYLASGEALVRNLLNGYRYCRRFGVKCMLLGYGADNFGHVSQLPQLYLGFDIDTAIQGRGVESSFDNEFLWQGADKSIILVVNMKYWYCHAEGSPKPGTQTLPWFSKRISQSKSSANTKHLLLMNGCDHTPMDHYILDNIKELQRPQSVKELDDAYTIQSNFEYYVKEVKRELTAKKVTLKARPGEQRVAVNHLSFIYSNKITQKQANWKCQSMLEHYAEPLRTFMYAYGFLEQYESNFQWYAWEQILKSHAHDSIGGCSVPEVHKDVDTRFEHCHQVVQQLVDESLIKFMRHVDLKESNSAHKVVVVNTLNINRVRELVVVKMDLPSTATTITVRDGTTGKVVRADIIDTTHLWDFTLPYHGFRRPFSARRAFIAFEASVPSMGYRTFDVYVNPTGDDYVAPDERELPPDNVLENKYLYCTVQDDGSLHMLVKSTSTLYVGLNLLELQSDHGDEYNSNPSSSSSHLRNVTVEASASSPIGDAVSVTGHFMKDGKHPLHVRMVYWLPLSSKRVEVRTSVLNKAYGFRLRARFSLDQGGDTESERRYRQHERKLTELKKAETPDEEAIAILTQKMKKIIHDRPIVKVDSALVDGHFDVVRRGKSPFTLGEAQQDFVALYPQRSGDGTPGGITVANRGLPEYQVLDNSIYLTLLRATGRMGDWGVFPSSPSSQEPGTHSFEYAVIPNSGKVPGADDGTHSQSRAFNAPMVGVHAVKHPGLMSHAPLFDLDKTMLYHVEHALFEKDFEPVLESPSDRHPRYSGSPPAPLEHWPKTDLPALGKLLDVEPSTVLVLSAVKLSERRGATLAKGMPNSDEQEDSGRSIIAWEVKLNEERIRKLSVTQDNAIAGNKLTQEGYVVSIKTGPKKIITLEFVLKDHQYRGVPGQS